MAKIEWKPEAEHDLNGLVDFIAQDNPIHTSEREKVQKVEILKIIHGHQQLQL